MLEEIGRGDILAENSGYSSLEMDMRLSLKAELLSLYRLEERNLILKSKLTWLKLGDENSSFFHHFLAEKNRRNLISELINEQGILTNSFREIENLILGFY